MRVYLPMTPAGLAGASRDGGFAVDLAGHARTAALVSALGSAGEEEQEYVALTMASVDSLALLAAEESPTPVRVVAVVEADEVVTAEGPDDAESAVRVTAGVPWRRLAAVHVDEDGAAASVAAALAAHRDASPGVAAADEAVLDHELGWYAPQEVPGLLARWGLGSSSP